MNIAKIEKVHAVTVHEGMDGFGSSVELLIICTREGDEGRVLEIELQRFGSLNAPWHIDAIFIDGTERQRQIVFNARELYDELVNDLKSQPLVAAIIKGLS